MTILAAMSMLCLDVWCEGPYNYSFDYLIGEEVHVTAYVDGKPKATAFCPIDDDPKDQPQTPFFNCVSNFDDLNRRRKL